jgi:hypothetical protein
VDEHDDHTCAAGKFWSSKLTLRGVVAFEDILGDPKSKLGQSSD